MDLLLFSYITSNTEEDDCGSGGTERYEIKIRKNDYGFIIESINSCFDLFEKQSDENTSRTTIHLNIDEMRNIYEILKQFYNTEKKEEA